MKGRKSILATVTTAFFLLVSCKNFSDDNINSTPNIQASEEAFRSMWIDQNGAPLFLITRPFALPTLFTHMPDPAYFDLIGKTDPSEFPADYKKTVAKFPAYNITNKNGLVTFYGRAETSTVKREDNSDPDYGWRNSWTYFPKCAFNLGNQNLPVQQSFYNYYRKANEYFDSVNLETLEIKDQYRYEYDYEIAVDYSLPASLPPGTGFCQFQLLHNRFFKSGRGSRTLRDGKARFILSISRNFRLTSQSVSEEINLYAEGDQMSAMLRYIQGPLTP